MVIYLIKDFDSDVYVSFRCGVCGTKPVDTTNVALLGEKEPDGVNYEFSICRSCYDAVLMTMPDPVELKNEYREPHVGYWARLTPESIKAHNRNFHKFNVVIV